MKKQKLPKGWSSKQIRELAKYYDRQTEEEQAAEIEAVLDDEAQTLLVVPTARVPEILQMISKRSRGRVATGGKGESS